MRAMKIHRAGWEQYNPERGQDRSFDLGSGVSVSSREFGVWVAEGPSTDWSPHVDLVGEFVSAAGGHGFFTYVPWLKRTNPKLRSLKEAFPDVIELEWLWLGSAREAIGIVERVFQARAALGGDASGLWALGTADSTSELAEKLETAGNVADSPVFGIAAVMPLVRFALCLDDGVDMLFSRMTPSMTPLITEVSTRLHVRN